MEPGERKKAVRALFVATGEAHHVAFAAADGDDPEWPAWYAAYLQPRLAEEAGITIAHNQLERLLVEADRAFENQTVEKDWAEFYADLLLSRIA
ncbi:MAG: hypothetical protein ACK2UW_08560 [Anaerolineales bacterium]|jgi:NAD(P)H-hydrate epimerase